MEGKKKESVFKKIERSIPMQVLIFMVSMVVIVGGYVLTSNAIQLRNSRQFDIIPQNFSWLYQIDSIEEQNKVLVLQGWAFKLNENATENAYDIILAEVETGERYYPQMEYVKREDINQHFECEFNYAQCGFTATINLKKNKMDNGVYEIILRPKNSEKAFATGLYYTEGEITTVNPKEFIALQTEGTALDVVVKEGILKVYRPDYGMYVYQYEGNLYWIADENYFFEEDQSTYIQFQLWTTQINNLPEYRIENNWLFDNIGFYFENAEMRDMNTGKYRVAKRPIPTEYSVRRIETGYYVDGEWIWASYFWPNIK